MTGKYAFFLWGSYGLSAAVLLWNAVAPLLRHRALLRELAERVDEEGGEAAESEVNA